MIPETTDDKIRVMNTRIQVEKDPIKKQELQKQLRVLNYRREIEKIKKLISQLS